MKKVVALASILFISSTAGMAATQPSGKGASKSTHIMVVPEEFKWVDGPEGLPPGAKMVLLEGNPAASGPFAMRIKVPGGYKIPAHWHPTIEHVTVLKGTFFMGEGDKLDESKGKELPAGSFIVMPKKMHHFAWSGNDEAIIQLHAIGPWGITYIDSKDDPRKNKAKS